MFGDGLQRSDSRCSLDWRFGSGWQAHHHILSASLVYYRNADVFVSASQHEGFGVPLLEAMWHSVPVVAVASSAVSDTVGDAGIVLRHTGTPGTARLAAAVHRAVADQSLRAHLVERGRLRVESFSLSRGRDAYRRAIANLLDHGGDSRDAR